MSLTDGAEKLLIGYTYTASGTLKEIQTQNGFVASYEYDDDGNLSHLRIGSGEDSLLYDAFLSYDLTGNRTSMKACRYALAEDAPVVDWEETYCYNEKNELTGKKDAVSSSQIPV